MFISQSILIHITDRIRWILITDQFRKRKKKSIQVLFDIYKAMMELRLHLIFWVSCQAACFFWCELIHPDALQSMPLFNLSTSMSVQWLTLESSAHGEREDSCANAIIRRWGDTLGKDCLAWLHTLTCSPIIWEFEANKSYLDIGILALFNNKCSRHHSLLLDWSMKNAVVNISSIMLLSGPPPYLTSEQFEFMIGGPHTRPLNVILSVTYVFRKCLRWYLAWTLLWNASM